MKFDLKNSTVKLTDAGSNELTIKLGDGTIQSTEQQNIEYVLDAGRLDTKRKGDEVPASVTLDAILEVIIGSGDPDAIRKFLYGEAEDAQSVAAACEPYACNIEITWDLPCAGSGSAAGTGNTKRLTYPEFTVEQVQLDVKTSMLQIQGKINAERPLLENV